MGGAAGVAAEFTVNSWICVVPAVLGLIRLTPLGWRVFFTAICRPAIVCGAAYGLVALALRWCESFAAVLPFAGMVVVFSVAYTTLWLLPAGGINALRAMIDLTSDKP